MSGDQRRSVGFWAGFLRQFRLAWRLLWDPRVSGWTKLVPLITFLYIFSPLDFIPDWFLGLGQLDDLGALLLGIRLFTELIPEEIVLQHLEAMGFNIGHWRVMEEEPPAIDADAIDVEYEVRDE